MKGCKLNSLKKDSGTFIYWDINIHVLYQFHVSSYCRSWKTTTQQDLQNNVIGNNREIDFIWFIQTFVLYWCHDVSQSYYFSVIDYIQI